MKLEELIRDTDALTYLNALKVTLTSIKEKHAEVEEQASYIVNATNEIKRLVRKADNQYRLLTKLVQKDAPLTSDITINDALNEIPDIEELMENA